MTITPTLDGRTVIVTGGNGGIGLAIARGVGAAGARVAIWGRNEAKNGRALEELRASGITAEALACDVSSERDVVRAMEETVERFGRVDTTFANAGVSGPDRSIVDLSLEEWRAVMTVDVDGVFLTLRETARHLVERRSAGALVVVSSIVTHFGAARKAAYGTAKPAVEGLMRSLAVELAPRSIRCNALAPGWTDTEMLTSSDGFDAGGDSALRDATVARTPMRRWATPDDLCAAAVFLADPALAFHTGDVVRVDGGYSIA